MANRKSVTAMSPITIFKFPTEMIYMILSDNRISIEDYVNFCSTCKYFHEIIEKDDNPVWQEKFYLRWPKLKKICEEKMREENINFKELVKARMKCREIQYYLEQIRERCNEGLEDKNIFNPENTDSLYQDINLFIDQNDLDFLIHRNNATSSMNYYLLIDELQNIMNDELTYDWTNICAAKFIPYLKQYHLKEEWQKFIKRPATEQLFEEAATFAMQWFLPDMDLFYWDINREMDNISQEVLEHLKNLHSLHPIFSVSDKQKFFWKCNNIDENQWNSSDGKQILDIIPIILREHEFHELGEIIEIDIFLEDFILNRVLTKYINCILEIVFHSVARRLGIFCDFVSHSDGCFSLTWMPKHDDDTSNDPNHAQPFFIIFMEDGTILIEKYSEISCLKTNHNTYVRINPTKLILNLTERISLKVEEDEENDIHRAMHERWILEFRYLVDPYYGHTILQLSSYYCNRNMMKNLTTITTALREDVNSVECEKVRCATLLLRQIEKLINYRKERLEIYPDVPTLDDLPITDFHFVLSNILR